MELLHLYVLCLWVCGTVIQQVKCGNIFKEMAVRKMVKKARALTAPIDPSLNTVHGRFPTFNICSNDAVPPIYGPQSIPIFVVDLDAPPKLRWKHVVQSKKKEMNRLLVFIKTSIDSLFGKSVFNLIEKYLPKLLSTLEKEHRSEIKGIADQTNIKVAEVILFNVFYEFFSLCTSVVMEDVEGNMYHGRNLDFSTYLSWDRTNKSWVSSEELRDLTVKINFVRNKTILYSSVNFAGYVGILTAVKKDRFSLTINERFKVNGGYVGLIEWILGLHQQQWVGFLTRQVMEKADSYEEALEMLKKPKLLAPVYFILSGNNSKQAAVITRDRRKYDIWNFGSKYAHQHGDWYLVQTNYDHWKPPPRLDDRITPVTTCADEIGNKNSTVTMYQVLSTVPVLNHETVYTSIMEIKTGTLYTWLRHCQWPC